MTVQNHEDRVLPQVIIYGFSLAFGLVIASLEALHPAPAGFTIRISWLTLLAFVAGAALLMPCFRVIVCSHHKRMRTAALGIVVLLGLAAFFVPLRVVPREKLGPVMIGLAAAVAALSVIAGLLLLLHRFFEDESKPPRH